MIWLMFITIISFAIICGLIGYAIRCAMEDAELEQLRAKIDELEYEQPKWEWTR